MFKFLDLHPEAFGIDISDLSLKIIKLKKKRGVLELVSFGETLIKQGLIEKGEIKDEKSLVDILKKAIIEVKGEKITSRYIIGSLPEENAFLQVIQMPRMKKEELKKAVYFEAENYIPLPINNVYLDSQIVPSTIARKGGADHLEVLIAALPKNIVDSYTSLFQKAGLIPKVLEIESQAISRALVKNANRSSSSLLIIDLGATRTSFIIFSRHSLRFTSSIPISSYDFTKSIAESLSVDLKQAEKLKLKYGMGNNYKKSAISPVLNELKEQIKKHLRYSQSHLNGKNNKEPSHERKIEKIILCGGGANLKGLADFLSLLLKLPVEIGNPWINIGPNPSLLPLGELLKYTTAIGLALRDND